MTPARGVFWLAHAWGILLLTQVGTGCGLVEETNGSDGMGDDGSGGQIASPWDPYEIIVEGCGSPTYMATSFCYADCPNYDPGRAACDPLCVGYPPPGCIALPMPSTGGSSTGGGSPEECISQGGQGGAGVACTP